MKILKIDRKDPQLKATDPRVVNYKGDDLLTTVAYTSALPGGARARPMLLLGHL